MIKNLSIEYFKCFEKAYIDIAPLTLLTGLNSSGKSSVIQAIRIANDKKLLEGYGNCVSNLGKKAVIKLETSEIESCGITIDKVSREVGQLGNHVFKICDSLNYISANRVGPVTFLPFKRESKEVGEKGENVLSFIDTCQSGVPEGLRRAGFEELSSVKEQIRKWLEIITPGLEFDYQIVENADIAYSTFSNFRAMDVGFGLSYALPIIVSILINSVKKVEKPDYSAILLIENPEAHLHPRGQTEMGLFLASAAACGIQIILETHSDHLLNGIRIAVKDKKIDPEDTIFHFFEYNYKEEKSIHSPIYIDENGMMDNWPDGFFDETEKNLLKLI